MIQSFGWSDSLQQDFAGLAGPGQIPGRVTVQQRGHYVLATDMGEITAQISGRLAHEAGEGGYPVVGDTLYGGRAIEGGARHLLHASSIGFKHPENGAPTRINSPLPADFRAALERAGISVPTEGYGS